jgi:hypothetical protein
VSPFSTPLYTNWSGVEWSGVEWSGVEWSGALLYGLHRVVAKGVPKWCQFWRCIDRENRVIQSI